MMKLLSLPLAVGLATLCAAAVAQAQSSVTLFGLIDTNYARFRGQGNGSVTMLGNDGYQSTRIGFRGTEDLGAGLKASFWLEGAFTPDDGRGGATNANNQPSGAVPASALTFGRRSTVSVAGPWGELRLGRDYVPGFWNLSVFNPFGTNGVGSSGFLFYPVQSAARITNVRASNSIGYFLPENLGGFYGQAMAAFGENPSNSGTTEDDGKVWGARVGYASGPLDVAVGITKTKISTLGDLTQSNVGAKYDFGPVAPMLLWNENKVGATRTRTWLVGALVPVGVGQVRIAWSHVQARGIANDASQWALGYVHPLSKRTALYANWSRIDNRNGGTNYNVGRATTTPGGNASGYELGVRHAF